MKTARREELREPVQAFAARLAKGDEFIPLRDLAGLFGADEALLSRIESRGDIRFRDAKFVNDGPELAVPAGSVELEVPNLMRGTFVSGPESFTLTCTNPAFTLRACAKIAILRKCFDLRELRADAHSLELDFGNAIADRRYEF
ncbi:MAG: hypothetical protein ACYTEG_06365 [Planctomycetota bacterium]|jgi:hypothetical protein